MCYVDIKPRQAHWQRRRVADHNPILLFGSHLNQANLLGHRHGVLGVLDGILNALSWRVQF